MTYLATKENVDLPVSDGSAMYAPLGESTQPPQVTMGGALVGVGVGGAGVLVGDEPPWIWSLVQDHFYDAREAVDWYHALEHLADVAGLLYEEETPAAKKWYKSAEKALYQGHAERIAEELLKVAVDYPEEVAHKLQNEAAYLDTHKRRMQYLELREDGYVIGSGVVESAAKQYKARYASSGMRWSRPGTERLLLVRSALLSGRFDSTWKQVYKSPQN